MSSNSEKLVHFFFLFFNMISLCDIHGCPGIKGVGYHLAKTEFLLRSGPGVVVHIHIPSTQDAAGRAL